MSGVDIVTYSHGFIVRSTRPHVHRALIDYCKSYLGEWAFEKPHPKAKARRVLSKVYGGATSTRQEFRFHINCFDDVIAALDRYGIGRNNIHIEHKPPPQGAALSVELKSHVAPRDYQRPVIIFLASHDQPNKIVDMATGLGKTISSLLGAVEFGQRTLIQLRGGFVSRWTDELENIFHLKKEDVLVIRGRDALISLINQGRTGQLQASFIIITWKTLFNFYKAYEKDPVNNPYQISPEELCEICQIGLRIKDEVHLDFHLNFRSDVYTNVLSTIHLSATLETDDKFRRRMYDICMPSQDWYQGMAYDAYIGVYALYYTTEEPRRLRTVEFGDDRYSHQAYEKSIMRYKPRFHNYCEIICHPLDKWLFDEQYENGQKAIIFCSLVDFCYRLSEYLQHRYPNVSVATYVSETDESVLQSTDILVTTIESCGVAVDIPNLKVAVLTRALAKREANQQVMGRLRKLKRWPHVTPIFAYLVNRDVDKHVEYDEKKWQQFKGKVLFHRVEYLQQQL